MTPRSVKSDRTRKISNRKLNRNATADQQSSKSRLMTGTLGKDLSQISLVDMKKMQDYDVTQEQYETTEQAMLVYSRQFSFKNTICN